MCTITYKDAFQTYTYKQYLITYNSYKREIPANVPERGVFNTPAETPPQERLQKRIVMKKVADNWQLQLGSTEGGSTNHRSHKLVIL